jgi:hypothetical protein
MTGREGAASIDLRLSCHLRRVLLHGRFVEGRGRFAALSGWEFFGTAGRSAGPENLTYSKWIGENVPGGL